MARILERRYVDEELAVDPPELPPEVVALRVDKRAYDADRMEALQGGRLQELKLDVLQGVGLFLVANCAYATGLGDLLLILAGGALAGLVWWRLPLGSVGVGLVAALFEVLVCAAALLLHDGYAAKAWSFGFLFGTGFTALAGSYLGLRREQRAYE